MKTVNDNGSELPTNQPTAKPMSRFLIVAILALASGSNAQNDPAYAGPWRNELDSCWTRPVSECNRALTIVHGGDWNIEYPYDSMPAFQRGFDNQADVVKGDFRVNKENVGMVMHSSPIEVYESINCFHKKVEEMTTAECEKCKMEITSYNFTSAPELLSWSAGKVNVMFCVKEQRDIPRAMSTLVESNASHRALLEISVSLIIQAAATNTPHWDEVYYIAELSTPADVQLLSTQPQAVISRCLLLEFKDWEKWGPTLSSDLALVHKMGLRAVGVTASNSLQATKGAHLDIWNAGFDVVYTYNLGNAVEARVEVNTERGLPMP